MMTSTESLSRLTGGKTGGDGHADVPTIVERAAIFELRIVQGKAASCTDIARKTLRPSRGEKLDHTCMNFCHSVTHLCGHTVPRLQLRRHWHTRSAANKFAEGDVDGVNMDERPLP